MAKHVRNTSPERLCLMWDFQNCLYHFSSLNVKEFTDLLPLTAMAAWNGRRRPKMQKSLEIPIQNAYVWCEISKTVLNNFLAQILRKLQIFCYWRRWLWKTADGGWKQQKKTSEIPIHIAYVGYEISKTVLKIFLTQILRKLQFCRYWRRWPLKTADGGQKRWLAASKW